MSQRKISPVDYDHNHNRHTVGGARAALNILFANCAPESLLDVGCGRGTWLRAAMDMGVRDIFGVDGAGIMEENLLFPAERFRQINLCEPWKLDRRYAVALCLEVAEHLPHESAENLIRSLITHADTIIFSAAIPGQSGQHHVNCQWPQYWQKIFNQYGFACDDSIRWKIWDIPEIEPWYRQNIFVATYSLAQAGEEERISAVVHTEMLDYLKSTNRHEIEDEIEDGVLPTFWYVSTPFKAGMAKLKRKIHKLIR